MVNELFTWQWSNDARWLFEAAFLDIHLQDPFLNYCSMSVSEAEMINGTDECDNDRVSVFASDRVCLVNQDPKDR